MTLLIAGLGLWYVSHLLKRLVPGLRAGLGEARGKMLVTVLSLVAVVAMILGYRDAPIEPVYAPLPGIGHLNNLLMLVALILFSVSHSKGRLRAAIRHPMLWGTVLWAAAHLLVNGDAASLVLFGGIGVWAMASMVLISLQEPWVRRAPGPLRSDVIAVVAGVAAYAVVAGIHVWLGYNPFLGTYA